MRTRTACIADRLPARSVQWSLLLAVVALLYLQSTTALAATPPPAAAVVLPEPVVLVLKLVSANYVKPTTGVVITDDGLVLVPAGFVSAGDEIVVMDGGTDITRNARPSRPVKRSISDGLAVLSVEGLARPGIIQSEGRLSAARVYHLAAFPVAEKIAQGAQPLWLPVKLVQHAESGRFSVSAETPLPATSGAIIDDCGYLVGLSLAADGSDAAADKKPVAILGDDLSLLFDSMQIKLKRAVCKPAGSPEPARETPVKADRSAEPEQVADIIESKPAEETQPANITPTGLEPGNPTDSTPPVDSKSEASIWAVIPGWIWLTGAVILLALLAKFIVFLRQSRRESGPGGQRQAPVDTQPASDEPDTAPLHNGPDVSPHRPAAASAEDDIPDLDALPDGYDSLVVIEGWLGDGTGFKRYCPVNSGLVDVVIGRGDAELSIEMPAISRRHVRLENADELLTVSDLGSSNGTFIRGIPCLPGEVMFIGPEDEILLGDVRFHIHLLHGAKQ